MTPEETLLQAIATDPGDNMAWLALADCLEENGEIERAELVRVRESLREFKRSKSRGAAEDRLRELLAAGVRPTGPVLELPLNPETLRLALIPPGTFRMGSPTTEAERWADDEGPTHLVTISKGFYLGVIPVTQAQWTAIMPDNPSEFAGPELPVQNATWYECMDFCKQLGDRFGGTYRTPTEAEWEYACRGGTTTAFHFGETITPELANYDANILYPGGKRGLYRERPIVPGQFLANAWGLYDMHGNIREWCADGSRTYTRARVTDPVGSEGERRTVRGGSWYNVPRFCRSAFRYSERAIERDNRVGLRVLREL